MSKLDRRKKKPKTVWKYGAQLGGGGYGQVFEAGPDRVVKVVCRPSAMLREWAANSLVSDATGIVSVFDGDYERQSLMMERHTADLNQVLRRMSPTFEEWRTRWRQLVQRYGSVSHPSPPRLTTARHHHHHPPHYRHPSHHQQPPQPPQSHPQPQSPSQSHEYCLRLWLAQDRRLTTRLWSLLQMAVDIARGVEAMHHLGWIHGDITARNILVSVDRTHPHGVLRAYLADLGLSAPAGHAPVWYTTATHREVMPRADLAHDTFSLGLVLLHMFTGQGPPDLPEPVAMCGHARETLFYTPVQSIVLATLHPDRTRRPSSKSVADQLQRVLTHLGETHIRIPQPIPHTLASVPLPPSLARAAGAVKKIEVTLQNPRVHNKYEEDEEEENKEEEEEEEEEEEDNVRSRRQSRIRRGKTTWKRRSRYPIATRKRLNRYGGSGRGGQGEEVVKGGGIHKAEKIQKKYNPSVHTFRSASTVSPNEEKNQTEPLFRHLLSSPPEASSPPSRYDEILRQELESVCTRVLGSSTTRMWHSWLNAASRALSRLMTRQRMRARSRQRSIYVLATLLILSAVYPGLGHGERGHTALEPQDVTFLLPSLRHNKSPHRWLCQAVARLVRDTDFLQESLIPHMDYVK